MQVPHARLSNMQTTQRPFKKIPVNINKIAWIVIINQLLLTQLENKLLFLEFLCYNFIILDSAYT